MAAVLNDLGSLYKAFDSNTIEPRQEASIMAFSDAEVKDDCDFTA